MARTNSLGLLKAIITNEIRCTDTKIAEEAKTEHYGKAYGFQKYKEGLEAVLGFMEIFDKRSGYDTKQQH